MRALVAEGVSTEAVLRLDGAGCADRLLIAFDPNVRLLGEPDIGRWRKQFASMLTRCDLLKISEEDLAPLRPAMDLHEFAAHALKHGVKAVVVTRGEQGAIGWNASGASATIARVTDQVVTPSARAIRFSRRSSRYQTRTTHSMPAPLPPSRWIPCTKP